MTSTSPEGGRPFEDDVRRIARELWPAAEMGGSAIIESQERDGLFETEESVNLIECTTLRTKEKAVQDIGKLARLLPVLRRRYPMKVPVGWFITRDEPTADQRAVCTKAKEAIRILSYDQFRARLIDARTYLDCRGRYHFGSVRPFEGRRKFTPAFVAPHIGDADASTWSIKRMSEELMSGRRVTLLGDYGSGKSATLREVYLTLANGYFARREAFFPLHLNLRDHNGQVDPAEALERHARTIGFGKPHHLVRAWRAGRVILVLDGFDELGRFGWLRQGIKLVALRRESMRLIREFVSQTPEGCGLLLAGRAHYFDSKDELRSALGVRHGVTLLDLNDFTDEQVREFLVGCGWTKAVPRWLPTKPLLLGYLAAMELLSEVQEVAEVQSPAQGWDGLIDRVCEREAEVAPGIDGATVRLIIEKLATRARCGHDGLGPIASDTLMEVFQEVCGYPPDESGLLLLQRLPGLGVAPATDNSRVFIDQDFVDVARAGDVGRFIESPFTEAPASPGAWQVGLGDLGMAVVEECLRGESGFERRLSVAAEQAAQRGWQPLAMDILNVLVVSSLSYVGGQIYVSGVIIVDLCFGPDNGDLSAVELQDCIIQRLELDRAAAAGRLPRFVRCAVMELEGRSGREDLPAGVFDGACEFDVFGESMATTAGILSSSLSLGVRVMLTILRKTFMQRGHGRKEGALFRGLDQRAQRLVSPVLAVLSREGIIVRSSSHGVAIWLPNREQGARVRRLLGGPAACKDELIAACDGIGG